MRRHRHSSGLGRPRLPPAAGGRVPTDTQSLRCSRAATSGTSVGYGNPGGLWIRLIWRIDALGVGVVAVCCRRCSRKHSLLRCHDSRGFWRSGYYAAPRPNGPHTRQGSVGSSGSTAPAAPLPTLQQAATCNAFLLLAPHSLPWLGITVRSGGLHRGDDRNSPDQAGQHDDWPAAPRSSRLEPSHVEIDTTQADCA